MAYKIYDLGKVTSSFIVLDTFLTFEELEETITNPDLGDTYAVGSEPPYTYYSWERGNKWADRGTFQGEPGEPGQPGETPLMAQNAIPFLRLPEMGTNINLSSVTWNRQPNDRDITYIQGEISGLSFIVFVSITFEMVNATMVTMGEPISIIETTGKRGATGATGQQGGKGDKGDTGEQGIQGEPGADGQDGEPGLNEITTDTATNITGLLKGNGGAVEQAIPDVDYLLSQDYQGFFIEDAGSTPSTRTVQIPGITAENIVGKTFAIGARARGEAMTDATLSINGLPPGELYLPGIWGNMSYYAYPPNWVRPGGIYLVAVVSASQYIVLNPSFQEGSSTAAGILKVFDNLTSTDATSALSANQGKVLGERVAALETALGNISAALDAINGEVV